MEPKRIKLKDAVTLTIREAKKEDAAEILRLLDRVTARVLVLDSGYGGEAWFKSSLSEWNDEQIRSFILQHTTFTQVVPLGRDADGQGDYGGQFGRTLFACIR